MSFSLFVAGHLVRCVFAAEAEIFLVHDDVDVFGKALDEFPCLRKRCAALEGEVLADAGQGEEFAQGPTHPQILLHADSLQAHFFIHLLECCMASGCGKLEESVHGQLDGSVKGRSRSAIQAGA